MPIEDSAPEPLPFVRERRSPIGFDPARTVSDAELDLVLDAARRAPSAGNSQPWAFLPGRRGDETHARLVRHLARSSARWAPDASVLVANLAHIRVEGSGLEYSEFSLYDLGQAVSHLIFQAHALGLQAHQFRAFDRDAMEHEFAVPAHWRVATMLALGAPHPASARVEGTSTDERLPLDEVVWHRIPADRPGALSEPAPPPGTPSPRGTTGAG